MKLITYKYNEKEQVGVLSKSEKTIYPIAAYKLDYKNMNDLIENVTDDEMNRLKVGVEDGIADSISLDCVELLAPIKRPSQDILCLGLNYSAHAAESARYKNEAFESIKGNPVYFSKRVNEAVAPEGDIEGHFDMTKRLDYEVELAVIIGKDARNLSVEEVKDYIFGYTIINEVSARDLQTDHTQWYFGKSLDGFTPMGPVIVTVDEIEYPPKLDIKSYVNGELRQNSNTEKFLHSIDEVIVGLSKGMTLRAGTIISTGTPEGVAMGMQPPVFLKAGDVVTCEIEGIGRIVNKVC